MVTLGPDVGSGLGSGLGVCDHPALMVTLVREWARLGSKRALMARRSGIHVGDRVGTARTAPRSGCPPAFSRCHLDECASG